MISQRVDEIGKQLQGLGCYGSEKVGAEIEDGPLQVVAGNEKNWVAWGRTVLRVETQEKLYDELEDIIKQLDAGARRRGLKNRTITIDCVNPAELTRTVTENTLSEMRASPRYVYDKIKGTLSRAYMENSHLQNSREEFRQIHKAFKDSIQAMPEALVLEVLPAAINSFIEEIFNEDLKAEVQRMIGREFPGLSLTPKVKEPGRKKGVSLASSQEKAGSKAEASRFSGSVTRSPVDRPKAKPISSVKEAADRAPAEELAMTESWLEFARLGDQKIPGQKHTLSGIRKFSPRECESHHDYIQLLFPNSLASRFNKTAPLLTPKMIEEIQTNPVLQQVVQQSVDQILDFWGLFRRGDQVFVNEAQSDRHCWCKRSYDHNESRVSRVLYFLMETGFGECARSFEKAVNGQRFSQLKSRSPHWQGALNAPEPPQRLSFST